MAWSPESQESGRQTMLAEERLGWQAWTPEQHKKARKKQYASGNSKLLQFREPEVRTAAALKAWETRRARYGPSGNRGLGNE